MNQRSARLLICIASVAGTAGCLHRTLGAPDDASLGSGDRVPDGSPGPNDVLPDPSPPCAAPIGTPCTDQADCCEGFSCVGLATGVKICTRPCTPSEPTKDAFGQYQDDCTYPHGYARCACDASLGFDKECPGFGGTCHCAAYYCMPRCEPKLGRQSCPEGIACDPRTVALTWPVAKDSFQEESESWFPSGDSGFTSAVCAHPACRSDEDCPVRLEQSCDRSKPGPLCAGSPPGAYCFAEPGKTSGTCALPGVCDPTSGLCAPHGLGNPGALVGDPCKDDRDCNGNMRCDQQRQDADGVHARNGYCYIEGCSFAASLPTRTCPGGSQCNHAYPGGRCFKTCEPGSPTDCRGEPADELGDYECYTWLPFAKGTCEPADHVPCNRLVGNDTCEDLGWFDDMACRDRTTGKKLPEGSPDGSCLDPSTSSGCLEGHVVCEGVCFDAQRLKTERENCGECGNRCNGAEQCISGACVCVTGDFCDGECVNLEDDPYNCGQCGKVCSPAQGCDEGWCG